MDRVQLRRLLRADTQLILDAFTTRQHLRPHQPIAQICPDVTRDVGCCPNAVAQAIQWLNIDPRMPIGRLRRSELMQLSRSIQRFWRKAMAQAPVSAGEI
jgi:hypothetical protein